MISLFGIKFIDGSYNKAIKRLKNGSFMVVPSGPGLAAIGSDLRYTEAVQNCDFAIPDSGYMVLLLKIIKGIKIQKLSGYDFLKQFLNADAMCDYLTQEKIKLIKSTNTNDRDLYSKLGGESSVLSLTIENINNFAL